MSGGAGFWGKIPSRGDFVGIGLPRDLVAAWDGWMSDRLAASQAHLGETWFAAWMEAPVWCFVAGASLLGAAPVAGVWMPSADRAGRAFPLLIASVAGADDAWFAGAEAAGRAALTQLLTPEALAAQLPAPVRAARGAQGSVWWTEGSPRVGATRVTFAALPGLAAFTHMLDDTA